MSEESIVITLPRTLVEKIKEKVKISNYRSVSCYIEDVIQEVFTAEEMEVGLLNREERAERKKILRELGYLE